MRGYRALAGPIHQGSCGDDLHGGAGGGPAVDRDIAVATVVGDGLDEAVAVVDRDHSGRLGADPWAAHGLLGGGLEGGVQGCSECSGLAAGGQGLQGGDMGSVGVPDLHAGTGGAGGCVGAPGPQLGEDVPQGGVLLHRERCPAVVGHGELVGVHRKSADVQRLAFLELRVEDTGGPVHRSHPVVGPDDVEAARIGPRPAGDMCGDGEGDMGRSGRRSLETCGCDVSEAHRGQPQAVVVVLQTRLGRSRDVCVAGRAGVVGRPCSPTVQEALGQFRRHGGTRRRRRLGRGAGPRPGIAGVRTEECMDDVERAVAAYRYQ